MGIPVISQLVTKILKKFPEAGIEVEAHLNSEQPTWVSITLGDQGIHVSWYYPLGYGLKTLPSENVNPDEIYFSIASTVARIEELLEERKATEKMRGASIRAIRMQQRVSLEDLAENIGASKSYVSQIERDKSMGIKTLKRLIEGLGGKLELVARFNDGAIRINQFDTGESQVA